MEIKTMIQTEVEIAAETVTGVASVSRLLKILGLFCKRAL